MQASKSYPSHPARAGLALLAAALIAASGAHSEPAEETSASEVADATPAAAAVNEPADKSASKSAPTELATLLVTAQRRSEDAGRIPLSLSVIHPEQLQAYGASGRDVLQLGGRAPSVYAESSFGRTFPRFYIRGLGNTDFDLNASQPVSMVLDDVVQENPALKGFPMFDLDRVEVLRGPQGTLFGRNTPGGVIKFESVRPDAEPSAYARIGYGRFDLVNFEGAAGGAVSENSSARLSVLYQARDDFSRNTARPGDRREGFTERALRGQWLYAPDNGFEALLQVRARKLNGGSAVFRANLFETGSNEFAPGFRRFRLAQDAEPSLDVKSAGASARLSWDLGSYRLVSISAWDTLDMFARGDVDGGFGASFAPPFGPGPIPFPAESGDGIPKHDQLTQELRLESSGDQAFRWQLGSFLFHERLDIDNVNFDTLAQSTENGRARQHQNNDAIAAYASVAYDFYPRWTLAGGLRLTHDDKDFWAERLVSPIGAGSTPRIRRNLSDTNLSGDASLSYAVHPDALIYARAASSFRAPAVQGRLLFGDTVSVADSEDILSFELGYKAEFWQRRARIGLSAFRYQLDDAQLTAVGGQANFNTLINANQVVGKGVELDLEAVLAERLTLSAQASFNDTELHDRDLAVAPCGSGCTVLDPAGPVAGTVLIDGNSLPQSPRWIGNLSLGWEHGLATGDLFVLADLSLRSKVNFFLYRSREFVGDPLNEAGLRVGYRWQGGRYELAAYGRNLFNETEALGAVDFNNLTGFVNEPRVLGVNFSVRL